MNPLQSLKISDRMEFQLIYNLLQRYQGRLKVFDLRPLSSFNYYHISGSIHISHDPHMDLNIDLLSLTKEKELSRLRRFCIIIGYDEDYQSLAEALYEVLDNLKCKEVYLVPNIEKFIEKYSFLTYEKLMKINFPNEIIPDFLYLGSQEHAHNKKVIDALGITHVLNATRTAANPFPEIIYCRVHVDDNRSEKISLWFEKAYAFIDKALEMNIHGCKCVILVHCAKGVSRSATLVMMYLMRAVGLSIEAAFEFIKEYRDIIEPNEGFMKELQEFEKNNHEFIGPRRASIA